MWSYTMLSFEFVFLIFKTDIGFKQWHWEQKSKALLTTMPSNQEVDKDAIVFGDDLELVLLMTKLNQLETHEVVVPAAQVMVHQVF